MSWGAERASGVTGVEGIVLAMEVVVFAVMLVGVGVGVGVWVEVGGVRRGVGVGRGGREMRLRWLVALLGVLVVVVLLRWVLVWLVGVGLILVEVLVVVVVVVGVGVVGVGVVVEVGVLRLILVLVVVVLVGLLLLALFIRAWLLVRRVVMLVVVVMLGIHKRRKRPDAGFAQGGRRWWHWEIGAPKRGARLPVQMVVQRCVAHGPQGGTALDGTREPRQVVVRGPGLRGRFVCRGIGRGRVAVGLGLRHVMVHLWRGGRCGLLRHRGIGGLFENGCSRRDLRSRRRCAVDTERRACQGAQVPTAPVVCTSGLC